MNKNSDIKPESKRDNDEKVKQLMKDPVVKLHCESLDKQGIKYKIIPLNLK